MNYFSSRRITSYLVGALLFSLSFAVSAENLRNVRIIGIQKINVDQHELLKALPFAINKHGDLTKTAKLTPRLSDQIIKDIYATGFVSDISVPNHVDNNGSLTISVVPRPMLEWVNIHGNSKITKKEMKPFIDKLGIAAGKSYSPYAVKVLEEALKENYLMLGYNKVKITTSASTIDGTNIQTWKPSDLTAKKHGRMKLDIAITEGSPQTIHAINFEGNKTFPKKILSKQIKITPKSLLSFLFGDDKYSARALADAVQRLSVFYMDHGYLNVSITHTVKQNEKNNTVDITFNIDSGARFQFGDVKALYSKNTESSEAVKKILAKDGIKQGAWYSRSSLIQVKSDIAAFYRNKGFANTTVDINQSLQGQKCNVELKIMNSGVRVYIRRISFSGNDHTQDIAVRNRIVQMEGSVYSQAAIDESLRRLRGMYFLTNLSVERVPVPGQPHKVDLIFHMKEAPSGQFGLQGGYSELNKFFVGLQVSKANFLGTGNQASINVQKGKMMTQFSASYTQPVLNANQVSRTISVNYIDSKPSAVGLSNYNMTDSGVAVSYGLPILFENNKFILGASFDRVKIFGYDDNKLSPSYLDFLGKYKSPYDQMKLNLGWQRQVLDQPVFPTSGSNQVVNVTLGVPYGYKNRAKKNKVLSLGYYSVGYDGAWYIPLSKKGFVLDPHFDINYGNGLGSFDRLPFFNNFYAGGITTLPGFAASSLGPKNPRDVSEALGGNFSVLGGVNFIFPNPISSNLRTALFADFGNVFDTHHVAGVHYEHVKLKNLRASLGLMLGYQIPSLGTLQVSIAKGLNSWVSKVNRKNDEKQVFGFTIARTF